MSEHETAKSINDAAAEWVARVDRAPDDEEVEAALANWLSGDERRRGAYFRAQAAWSMLDRASVLKTGYGSDNRERASGNVIFRRRFAVLAGAFAASAALFIAGFHVLQAPSGMGQVTQITTTVGEIRRMPLEDGTMAEINTNSRMAVKLEADIRRITLEQGEAFFQVAHDAARPFVVSAGDVRVEAVGTAFSVRRAGNGAEVQVTEGTVAVWDAAEAGGKRLVTAGSRAVLSGSGADEEGVEGVVSAADDIDRNLAWRHGQLIFEGDTLLEAVDELNRYNRIQVRVENPELSAEKLVGRFRTNEPEAFAKAAAAMLGAQMETDSDTITLTRK